MSTAEIKEEIQKAVKRIPEDAPESVLQNVLGYIQDITGQINEKNMRRENFKNIIVEDDEVLRKLAQ